MKNFLYKSLLTLLMDKRARSRLRDINTPNTKNDTENKEKKLVQSNKLKVPKDNKLNSEQSKNRASNVFGLKKQKSATKQRLQLIDNALAIYRSKRYIIDQLPKEQKEKLMFMALKLFGEKRDK